MRPLWPIERDILEAAATAHPNCAAEIRRQAETAMVADFYNSGAGFMSQLIVDRHAPTIFEKSPLNCPWGEVGGLDAEMGFIVFLKDGRLDAVEGFCNGESSTHTVDFSSVPYRLNDCRPNWDVATGSF